MYMEHEQINCTIQQHLSIMHIVSITLCAWRSPLGLMYDCLYNTFFSFAINGFHFNIRVHPTRWRRIRDFESAQPFPQKEIYGNKVGTLTCHRKVSAEMVKVEDETKFPFMTPEWSGAYCFVLSVYWLLICLVVCLCAAILTFAITFELKNVGT